jgi:hypothetical protein
MSNRHLLAQLDQRRAEIKTEAAQFLSGLERRGLRPDEPLPDAALRRFNKIRADLRAVERRAKEVRQDVERGYEGSGYEAKIGSGSKQGASSEARVWAQQAAQAMHRSFGGEQRAVVSGSIDIPSLVVPYVVETPWPTRLIDLVVNRTVAESNAFTFYQQTVKTNNAAPVADLATKPTSVFTVAEHNDRCRVIAHLSQPVPYRYLLDVPQLQDFLATSMYEGVMSALEAEIVSGSGSGEHMLGLLNTSGTTAVAFNTDIPTTLRHAQTQLQLLGERPNAIALHPADAETVDLTRWGTSGGLLTSGFDHPNTAGYGSSDNYFGPSDQIKRVISPSVPQGTGIVADWGQLKVFVRQDFVMMLNPWGDAEYSTNTYLLRGEGRYGIGLLRPQAFAVCDLTA